MEGGRVTTHHSWTMEPSIRAAAVSDGLQAGAEQGQRWHWDALHDLKISSALIFYVFLLTLIFASGFNLDAQQLRENLGLVLVLAGPGLLLSTIIGLIVGMATPIPYTAALLLGAILSATDPVAVIMISPGSSWSL